MPTIVRGEVSISQNNQHFQAVVASTTGHPLIPVGGTTTKGTGSYLSHLIVMQQVFTTVGSCAVDVGDGLTGTVRVHGNVIAGSAGLNADVSQRVIPLGIVSKFGPWRITTGGNVAVCAVGTFK